MARIIVGTNGADTIQSNGVESELWGLGGNDTYLIDYDNDFQHIVEAANSGTDTVVLSYFYGGSKYGSDYVGYTLADNVENLTADFYGGTIHAHFTGNALNNVITGGQFDDTLYGGVYGSAGGKDTLIGGDGNDMYYVDSSDDVIIEKTDIVSFIIPAPVPAITFDKAGEHDFVLSSAASYTLSANIEDIALVGEGNINATGNASANNMYGNGGNNTLSGLAGDDYLSGYYGNDKLLGGDGNDYLEGDADNDTLDGGTGNDYLDGNGRPGNGPTDNDSLIGGAGNDTLDSGWDGFADTLVGGAGDDVYYTDGLDVLNESAGAGGGIDTVIVTNDSDGVYILAANIENATITNSSGISNLTGNASANTLIGNDSDNLLVGLGGNDVLDGGEGDDTLAGGDGNDTYLVDSMGDVVIETNGTPAVGGKDTVYSDVSFMLGANVENLIFTSTAVGGSASIGQGNILDNVITGNESYNTLIGYAGNDTLDGGAGPSFDILIGGAGNDTFIVNSSLDQIIEIAESGAGGTKDKIMLSKYFIGTQYLMQTNVEQLDASAAISGISITGNNSANSIVGGIFSDTLDGRGGADTLVGGAGNDTYTIGAGDVVTEVVNAGDDTVIVNNMVTYTLTANVENGILAAGSGSLTGNLSNNLLKGNSGANSLSGGAGNDTLDGGAGADILSGGIGNDTYIFGKGDTVTGETGGTDTLFTNLSFIDLTITAAYGTGITAVDNVIYTGGGNFSVVGNGLANSIVGGDGNDTLNGGIGNVADTLDGGAGIDVMAGGSGNDTYFVDNTADVVTEIPNGGTDTVFSSASSYTLSAEVENLTLIGTANYAGGNSGKNVLTGNAENNSMSGGNGDDKIFGNDGNDGLDGGAGNDTMEGGKGDDTYYVDAAGDKVTESLTLANGGGYDTVNSSIDYTLGTNLDGLTLSGAAIKGTGNALDNEIHGNGGANILSGLDGNDYLVAYGGNDKLYGGNGNDSLFGKDDNDTLEGGAGNDYLNGGSGDDSMTGGAGDDFYVVDSSLDKVIEAAGGGNDTVRYEVAGTYTLSANVENAIFYGGGSTVSVLTGDTINHTIIAGSNGNNISTGVGNDTISLSLEESFVDTVNGGDGIDTFNITIGDFDGFGFYGSDYGPKFNNESVTSSLTGIENVVITSNGGAYGGHDAHPGGITGSHAWNLGGAFNGADAAHLNHITITGGEYGGGALALSGFGMNVDFTLQDYHRDSTDGGIDLTGVVGGGWSGSDTLRVTLDDFSGRLVADDALGHLDLTSAGGINAENMIDLSDFDTATATEVSITGDTSVSIAGLDSGAAISVNDFTGIHLGVGIASDGGSDTLALNISNSITAINNSVFETISLTSSGNNFLDLSNNMSTYTNISGADGLMAIKSNGGSISASNFSGTLVVDASAAGNALAVIGGHGDDLIIGSANNDNMWGSQGSDVLTGGWGNDIFNFSDMEDVDTITDFSSADDIIYLDHLAFTGLNLGALDAGNFFSAADVTDINLSAQAYILYDNNTGALYYDNDGTSTGDAVQFAQLGLNAPPSIDSSDFFIS